ncbi:MAG: A/G-specific adenine glycosylase [Salinisphaeraceae bacterium]|nr:A/G-specific adenine glycosylase [Salinisphaeraceae bacterium]
MPDAVAPRLLAWFDQHGRHDLPWQHPRSAYRVWVSEVMLQQTQVSTVIPYFERFMARLPDIASLAAASQDTVLELWAGLGYYSRARNLHSAAQQIMAEYNGEFPQTIDQAVALPGIGPSTAGAILAQAFGQKHAILDGNVKRVLSRYHAVEGWPGQTAVTNTLWEYAREHTPESRLADYTQAIMDLGATLCTRSKPRCNACPLAQDCEAHAQGRTHELPSPRPKKERPQRQTRMLVLCNEQGEVLLYKRPPAGIWGGLWSFPELPEQEDIAGYCQKEWSLQIDQPREVESIKHGFTHFELTIKPLLAKVQVADAVAREPGEQVWYKPDGSKDKPALPAPLNKLLHGKMLQSMINEMSG